MTGPARRHAGAALLLAVIALLINLPVLNMILASLRSTADILEGGSWFHGLGLQNFVYVSARTPFWTYFGNSVLIAVGATLVTVACSALAGYGLSRYPGGGMTVYSRLLLVIQMFPLILAVIPLFLIFRNLGLINHPLSVISVYAVVHLPFATWMFKAFFDSIPRELEEAALVDGCTRLQSLTRIVMPLAGPGTAAVCIFSFLFSYNEFFIANTFLKDEARSTLPVGIRLFMQQYSADWGSMMAAATLAMIPTFFLFLFVQKYLLYGAVGEGVKG